VRAVLTLLASLLPLLALGLFFLRLALILQPAQSLTNWCSFDTSLLLRGIIETGGGFFLEWNISVILYESVSLI
jgi:hypothetical protein